MTIGTPLIHWSARISFVLYASAVASWLIGKAGAARLLWTSALLCNLMHVVAAFQFRHHWSHAAAYEATARQTAALFGFNTGVGLYCNYAFTIMWALDVIWIWWSAETYRQRPHWIAVAIHSFMAFLFFNATVVFVSGPVRWLGILACIALGILWVRKRNRPAAASAAGYDGL